MTGANDGGIRNRCDRLRRKTQDSRSRVQLSCPELPCSATRGDQEEEGTRGIIYTICERRTLNIALLSSGGYRMQGDECDSLEVGTETRRTKRMHAWTSWTRRDDGGKNADKIQISGRELNPRARQRASRLKWLGPLADAALRSR